MNVHKLYEILGPPKKIGGLIILNGPPLDHCLLDLVWPTIASEPPAYPTICADGGANCLYETRLQKTKIECSTTTQRIPNQIVGDLDSITPSILNYYKSNGTHISKDEDQDSNDFDKSLCQLQKLGNRGDMPTVVIGGFGGRLDQTLGNLNSLYLQAEQQRNVWWLEAHNGALLLSKGKHRIDIDATREGPTIGLIPVGRPVESVTTEGLKWNLHDQTLAFGTNGLVSTSNRVMQSSIYITTSHPLLWTIEINVKS